MFRICCGQSEASLSSKKAKEEHWELGAEMPCAFLFVEHLCKWTVLNTPCRLTVICGRVTRFLGFLGYMLVFESCKIQGGKWWKSRIKEWRDGFGRFWAWLQVAQVVVASSRNHLFFPIRVLRWVCNHCSWLLFVSLKESNAKKPDQINKSKGDLQSLKKQEEKKETKEPINPKSEDAKDEDNEEDRFRGVSVLALMFWSVQRDWCGMMLHMMLYVDVFIVC